MTNPEGTDLERLRALAEKATPCAREVIDGNDGDGAPFRPLWQVQTPGVEDVGFPDDALAIDLTLHVGCKGDADFIAACDPSTILALIARCLAAEIALAEATKYMEHHAARAEKAESALAQAIAERDRMAEALTELVTNHIYKTPSGNTNCRYCDNNMDHEGTYENMHAPTCPIRRASQALTTTTEHEGAE